MSELPPSDGTLYQIKSAINLLINERCKAHGITVPQAIQQIMQLNDDEKPNEPTEAKYPNDIYQKMTGAIPATKAFGKTFLSKGERKKIQLAVNQILKQMTQSQLVQKILIERTSIFLSKFGKINCENKSTIDTLGNSDLRIWGKTYIFPLDLTQMYFVETFNALEPEYQTYYLLQ